MSWETWDAVQSPAQHNGLRIQHCHSCGLGDNCGWDLSPALRTPDVERRQKKKKKKKKEEKIDYDTEEQGNKVYDGCGPEVNFMYFIYIL